MKVLLLAGGDSSERSVSIESGKAVCDSLKRQGHVIFALDPASGKSMLGSDGNFISLDDPNSGWFAIPKKGSRFSLATTLGSPAFQDIDVVFITLHGGSGEDGILQCLLKIADKKFTGSDMTASAIAMDKAITKNLCRAENIDTPSFTVYRIKKEQIDDSLIQDVKDNFNFPVIVKPNDGGSTIGLSKVNDIKDLPDALEKCLEESSNIIIEEYINGREITAAVLDGEPLPLVEIISKNELYDFEAKYIKGMSEYVAPAKLDEATTNAFQAVAVKIYNMIGCSGLARVDFLLDETGKFYFLELNSLPGMTELSLAPMAAKAAGIDFDQLIEKLIESALKK